MDNIRKLIIEKNLISEGEVIGVGVSGGKDSMALLHYLKSISYELGFEVVAITVDHSIREESATDAMFVSDFCRQNRIRCYKFRINVPSLAKEKGISLESAAREARYGVFETVLSKNIVDKIALAHHESDQAETVLLHLLRGSGISGLKGMQPVRDKVYIRPMLNTTQQAIINYVNDNYIDIVEDKTNAESEFARNYIRNEVMPILLKKFPNAINAMINFAKLAKEDNDYIEQQVPSDAFIIKDKIVSIPLSYFVYPKSIISRMIFKALNSIGINKDIESKHIDLISDLAKSENGKKVELPNKLVAVKEYDYLTLTNKQKEVIMLNEPFKVGETVIKGVGKILGKRTKTRNDDGARYIDTKLLPKDAVWRFRENGDWFEKFGGGSKKLKAYLIDKKLPQRLRANLPVLADSDEVYVIAGVEISNKVRISESTNTMYRIEFIRENA